MRTFQNVVILAIIVGLVAYTIIDNIQARRTRNFGLQNQFEGFNIVLPDSFEFCQERVPLKEQDIRERFEREMYVNVYRHSSTYLIIKKANKWLPAIERILKAEGIPNDFKYLAVAESGLANDISVRGATGFWQFMPETAKELGLEVSEEVDERYDPIKSTKAACKYFKKAYAKFGNWTLVAASYNMGMSGLADAIAAQKVNNYYDLHLNGETSRYIFRVLAFKDILTYPEKYGFKLSQKQLYYEEKMRTVQVDSTIKDLVSFALRHQTNLKTLKVHNPWLRQNTLKVEKGKRYVIQIPENNLVDEADEALLEHPATEEKETEQ